MALVFESFVTSVGDLYQTIVGTGWAAQTFTPSTAHSINKVSLYIYKKGTPSAITVSIRETTGGAPSGGDKASGTIAVGDIGTSGAWVDCTFSSVYALSASTKYAIILRCTGSSGTHEIYWSYRTAGGYAGGNKDFSINSGSTWLGTTPTRDHHFKEYGGDFEVTTQACTNTIAQSSIGHGNLVDAGDSAVTQHGHCWSTSANPTTSDSKTQNGAKPNLGQFQSLITELIPGTTYYVAAYATNTEGTTYGDDVTITTLTTIRRRHIWIEGTDLHYFDEYGVERKLQGHEVTSDQDLVPWLDPFS